MNDCKPVIAIIGLGYVGLPLALEFGKHHETIGFDIKESLVENCLNGVDYTGEVDADDFKAAVKFTATSDPTLIGKADVIIGPVGIIMPHSMMGELTLEMAEAISLSEAKKILIPLTQENLEIVGLPSTPLPRLVDELIDAHLKDFQPENKEQNNV